MLDEQALGDGRRFVLEPGDTGFGRSAPIADQVRFLLADVTGRRDDFARRHIDPSFKPVVWTTEPIRDPALVGSLSAGVRFTANTATDLDRLATLGRRGWGTSGIRPDDRVLLVDEGHGSTTYWQMVLGCRNAGIALLTCSPAQAPALVAEASPTVVAGSSAAVTAVAGNFSTSVRSVVVDAGHEPAPLPDLDLPIAEWWTPPTARASWVSCPGGSGFHTWPEDELIEFVDGELIWSAVGWHGSVWLRVATGIAATVDESACTSCGRTTPRVTPSGRFR